MRKLLYILLIATLSLSCERRALTYDYSPTVDVKINADWSYLSDTPTGMTIYCYPESGESPTVLSTNDINTTTVSLGAGVYNILIFNNDPTSFSGTISFEDMESFETASVQSVSSALSSAKFKSSSDVVREPEELAAATYLDLEVTEDAVKESVELKSKGATRSDELIYATINVTPMVVVKTTRVKIRISGIHNFYSASSQIYGMASGYSFFEQASHSDMVTHSLDSWSSTTYDYDYREGEITTYFTSFGLPEQTTLSRSSDYSDWDGLLAIDILLVDLSTTVTNIIELKDKVVTSEDSSKSDNVSLSVSIDIDISSGYGLSDDDDPVVLQDVEPAGGSGSAFNATVDEWSDEEIVDIPL